MKKLLNLIHTAIKNKNWHVALFASLTLPDICGKIENPSQSSSDRYINWFNK